MASVLSVHSHIVCMGTGVYVALRLLRHAEHEGPAARAGVHVQLAAALAV